MCFICDGGTDEQLHELLFADIANKGWTFTAVEGFFPWTYTIGLAARGDPELVMLGPIRRAHKVLDELAGRVVAGLTLAEGDVVHANGEHLLVGAVHPRQVERGLLAGWFGYYDRLDDAPPLRILQILTPPRSDHPVLSARTLNSTANPLAL